MLVFFVSIKRFRRNLFHCNYSLMKIVFWGNSGTGYTNTIKSIPVSFQIFWVQILRFMKLTDKQKWKITSYYITKYLLVTWNIHFKCICNNYTNILSLVDCTGFLHSLYSYDNHEQHVLIDYIKTLLIIQYTRHVPHQNTFKLNWTRSKWQEGTKLNPSSTCLSF